MSCTPLWGFIEGVFRESGFLSVHGDENCEITGSTRPEATSGDILAFAHPKAPPWCPQLACPVVRVKSGDSPKAPPACPQLPMLNLNDPVVDVMCFGGVLNFAFFPDAGRPGQAANYYCSSPTGAWMWIGKLAPDSIARTFSAALRPIARCRRTL